MDKYIEAYNNKVDDNKKEKYTNKKDKYTNIITDRKNKDKHEDDLSKLAADIFEIKNLNEFCEKIQKEKEQKEKEQKEKEQKENIQNLLKEQGLDENLIDNILPENYEEFYNEFKKITNKNAMAFYITTNKNRQNYIKYYIEINNPKSEFYIEDVKIRENFLSKFQTLMKYNQIIGEQTLKKTLSNPEHIADLPYNDNEILLIFAQNLPETEYEIKRFKNNFKEIYDNVFKEQGQAQSQGQGQEQARSQKNYVIKEKNHRLGLFKYLIKNKKSVEESKTIIEEFKKIQEELNEVSNLGFIELMVKKVCDEQSKSNYYTENKKTIIEEFKKIKTKCPKLENSLIFEQIFGMFDNEHPNYIEEEEKRKKLLDDILDKLNRRIVFTNSSDIQKYILANKGRVICGEDTKDVKNVIMEALNKSEDKEQQDIANKLDKGEYIIKYNGEGGSSIEKFKIVEKDSKKVVKFLKFYSSTEKSPASSGVIPSEANKITSTSELINKSEVSVSTSGLCSIVNTQYNDRSIIMSDPAINPKEIKSSFIHAGKDGMNKALNGESNITYKNNNNTLGGILSEKTSNPRFCIDCIKSFYANIAVSSLFNFFDDRFDGNILLNSETGKFQVIDYDEEENLTIAGHRLNMIRPTKFGSERQCLKGKEVAINISELMINSYSGYFYAMDDIPLTAYEIITGKPAISQKGYEVRFSIPNMIKEFEKEIETIEQGEIEEDTADKINAINKTIEELRELQNYQDCIAQDMVILVETLDREIEKILKKEQELKTKGEKLSEEDEIHLGNCIEKRANAIAVFKTKTIGKHANELYKKQHEGHDIENLDFIFSETELQPIQINKSIEESKDYEFVEKSTNMLQSNEQLHKRMIECKNAIIQKYNKLLELKNSKQK